MRKKNVLPFWSHDQRADCLKGGLLPEGKSRHTELSTSTTRQETTHRKETNMKAATLTAVALLVLALGWTSEAVQVEVSTQVYSNSHSTRRKVLVPWYKHHHLPLPPGEWPVFFSGSCEEASGADRDQQRRRCDAAAQPAAPGGHRVPVCWPHAPSGVPAPLQAESSFRFPQQIRWDDNETCQIVNVKRVIQRSDWFPVFISAAVPIDVCEICAFAACTGC